MQLIFYKGIQIYSTNILKGNETADGGYSQKQAVIFDQYEPLQRFPS